MLQERVRYLAGLLIASKSGENGMVNGRDNNHLQRKQVENQINRQL